MKKTTKKKRRKGVATTQPTQEVVSQEIQEERLNQQVSAGINACYQSVACIRGRKLTTDDLQEAIILSEILGKPVSKRRDRHSRVGRL